MLFDANGGVVLQDTGFSNIKTTAGAIGFLSALKTSYTEKALFPHIWYSNSGTYYYTWAKKSTDGKTISWYNGYGDRWQFNESGKVYNWAIIG